jgi:hypothetical protein
VALIAAAVTTVTLATPSIASAAVSIPSTNPFKVPSDALGRPVAFTISANGFAAGAPVFVEQCDGTPPTTPGWNPNVNCDLGSAPAAVIADASGRATFPAGDPNRQFKPFRGPGPQGIFNCLNALDPSPANGLPDFTNCQVRISTNNTATTADQQFFTMQLPTGFTTNLGGCSGFKTLGKFLTPLSNVNQSITFTTALMKDLGTVGSPVISGACATPQAGFETMHPKAIATKLLGVASCAPAPLPGAYPLNGKASITMQEINPGTLKNWQIQAFFRIAGQNPSAPDVLDVSGIVIKGPAVGASVLGSVTYDPVSKVSPIPSPKPVGFTGYQLDLVKGAACQAGTGTIDTVQLTTGTSALGGYASGLQFGF